MEIYWPFKKKIKISIEDSEAEKARKAEEALIHIINQITPSVVETETNTPVEE